LGHCGNTKKSLGKKDIFIVLSSLTVVQHHEENDGLGT
jgi:hypothetical protein